MIPLLYLPVCILFVFPLSLSCFGKPDLAAMLKMNKLRGERARCEMQDALAECPASVPICTANWSSFCLRLQCWDLDREVSLAVLGRGGRWVTNLPGGCHPPACSAACHLLGLLEI